ncbi:hypothetical protein ALC57_15430 [Trachymyrmex cornetzi]|uniref:Retrotransposon gag domain-containing protein n=1 Tax=Trachymyrmex cornetzi TaxID=471704 RepID=A0A151IX49_9HYME|nr:hypothetical protein ALC57_15430 [Trachymyrmex cornetzi]
MGVKLKPDIYEGNVPLREYLAQFNLIAQANRWEDDTKTDILASCLRGRARAILENIQNLKNLLFEELKSKLEMRFGETQMLQSYYSQFTNRRQKFGESIASLGSDIERLSQSAYPECSDTVRDKIAGVQFISALSDGFVKRTLQIEEVTSLRMAIERAKLVKLIQESSFQCKKGGNYNYEKKKGKNFYFEKQRKNQNEDEDKERKFNKNRFKKFEKERDFKEIKKIIKNVGNAIKRGISDQNV